MFIANLWRLKINIKSHTEVLFIAKKIFKKVFTKKGENDNIVKLLWKQIGVQKNGFKFALKI